MIGARLLKSGIFASNGNLWKEHRTFGLSALRSFGFGKRSIENQITEEVSHLLEELDAKKGQSFRMFDTIPVGVANVICNISFGLRYDYDDEDFQAFHQLISDIFTVGTFGSGIVNYFPWMRILPGIR